MEEKLAYRHDSGNNDTKQTEIGSNLSELANDATIPWCEEKDAKTVDIFITQTKETSS